MCCQAKKTTKHPQQFLTKEITPLKTWILHESCLIHQLFWMVSRFQMYPNLIESSFATWLAERAPIAMCFCKKQTSKPCIGCNKPLVNVGWKCSLSQSTLGSNIRQDLETKLPEVKQKKAAPKDDRACRDVERVRNPKQNRWTGETTCKVATVQPSEVGILYSCTIHCTLCIDCAWLLFDVLSAGQNRLILMFH